MKAWGSLPGMKANFYRAHGSTLVGTYNTIELTADAASMKAHEAESIVEVSKAGGGVVAVVKLGERDYVRLEE